MRNLFYVLFVIGLLGSCKSIGNQTTDIDPALSSRQTKELIKKFKPLIQGVWVKKDYIDKVRKTKSPLAAADEATDLTTMYINTKNIKGDSLMIITGWGNHDGSQFMMKFKPGKTPSSLSFNGDELACSIEKGEAILTFSRFDSEKKEVVTKKFVRPFLKQPDNGLGYGTNYLVNKALVTGSYLLNDSTGSHTKVTFTANGKVNGFLNHSTYEINIDLNSDPMDNLDEIGFDIRTKSHRSFSYKISGDTLSLYNTYPNADSTELVLGKRIYKLVKQK